MSKNVKDTVKPAAKAGEKPARKHGLSREDERIRELLHGAYEESDDKAAADMWLSAWREVLGLYGGRTRDFFSLSETFHAKYSLDIYEWLDDMDEMFEKVLVNEDAYLAKWMKFQAQLLDNFTDLDEEVEKVVKTSLALDNFKVGNREEGDRLFTELVAAFPEDDMIYLYWSEPYEEDGGAYEKIGADHEKAMKILQKALEVSDCENREEIEDAMRELKKRMKKA